MSPRKTYFAYVRVSTQRQGQNGTSLAEQKAAIERYAKTWDLEITRYFEERETAAKQGRRVFLDMLKKLRQYKADGLIIHKIDRSARNLRDWAAIGDLIDNGIEIHFANESLDLTSRGGRLSADIQAVVAADYIRNLREEVKKGFYGRLKQGFYPMPAPIGYVDAGAGVPKRVDQVRGPLIRKAFELYARGDIGLVPLSDRMFEMGLRSKSGKKVTENSVATFLHNPFYTGLIKIGKTGQMFTGKHVPLISTTLFDQVQAAFSQKNIKRNGRHFFVFRRHIKCARCGNMLIPEKQKIYVYYRCQTRHCTPGTINERSVHKAVLETLERLRMNDAESAFLKHAAVAESTTVQIENAAQKAHLDLQLQQIKDRQSRLIDGYVDQVFDERVYTQKADELQVEEKRLKELKSSLEIVDHRPIEKLDALLELANSAYLSYKIGTPEEKRDLIKVMTSNFVADRKSVSIKLETPFELMANRSDYKNGGPQRSTTRTFLPLVKKLAQYISSLDMSKGDNEFVKYLISKNPPRKTRRISPRSLGNLVHL
jgi:site-specific DNA recombinase